VCHVILDGLEQFSIRVWCRMRAHADERALSGLPIVLSVTLGVAG
jgi:hypothetical protein